MICIFPRILSFIFLIQDKAHLELYVIFVTFYAKVQTVLLDSFLLPWHIINGDKKMKVMRRSVLRFTCLLQEDFFVTEHIHTSISVVPFILNFKKTPHQFDVLTTMQIHKVLWSAIQEVKLSLQSSDNTFAYLSLERCNLK